MSDLVKSSAVRFASWHIHCKHTYTACALHIHMHMHCTCAAGLLCCVAQAGAALAAPGCRRAGNVERGGARARRRCLLRMHCIYIARILQARQRELEGDNTRLSEQIHQQNGVQKARQNEAEDREVKLQEVSEGQRRLEKQVHYMVDYMVNNRVHCVVHCMVHHAMLTAPTGRAGVEA